MSYFGVHKQGLSLTLECPLSSISSFYELFKRLLRHKDGKFFVQGKCLFFIGKSGHAWKLCFQTYSPPPFRTQFLKNKKEHIWNVIIATPRPLERDAENSPIECSPLLQLGYGFEVA